MLSRHDPFTEMFESWNDFNGIFRRFLSAAGERPMDVPARLLLTKRGESAAFVPAVECYTKDKQVVLRAELPGVDPRQVEVLVVGDRLVIRGEKFEERQVEEKDRFYKEVAQGRFERSFGLPEGLKKEQIKASFLNGVLEITMPAAGIEAQHKVPVEILETGKKEKAAVKAA